MRISGIPRYLSVFRGNRTEHGGNTVRGHGKLEIAVWLGGNALVEISKLLYVGPG